MLKLQKYVKENDLKLDYKTTGINKEFLLKHYKHNIKKDNLPKKYKLEDNYCVDTYILKEGIKNNKSKVRHIDADKTKLIIANKASLKGLIIDDGRLGICGTYIYILYIRKPRIFKFYEKIFNYYSFFIFKIWSRFFRYRCFLYILDLTKLGYKNITEHKLYKLIGLSLNEIKDFKIKNYDD